MKFLAILKAVLYFCTIVRPVIDATKGVVSGLEKECKGKKLCLGDDVYQHDRERFENDSRFVPSFVSEEEEKEN